MPSTSQVSGRRIRCRYTAGAGKRAKLWRMLERMESRVLLSAISWTGLAGDNLWTTPGNWSGNALPGAADDVTISVVGNPTIVINGGTQTINSLTSDEAITLSNGTLSVATTSQVNAVFALAGGILTGAGNFTV